MIKDYKKVPLKDVPVGTEFGTLITPNGTHWASFKLINKCGAFGCGVFGQDAEDVCRFFVKYLTSSHRCFKKVIFAIPNDVHSENYDKFFKVLTEEKEKRNEKL